MTKLVVTAAAAAAALTAVDAAALPFGLGAFGVVAPQLSIAVGVPILSAAIVAGVVTGFAVYGAREVYKKAREPKK